LEVRVEIVPWLGDQPLVPSQVFRIVIGDDLKTTISRNVKSAQRLVAIFDDDDRSKVVQIQSQHLAILKHVDGVRKNENRRFEDAVDAINRSCAEAVKDLKSESDRLKHLLSDYDTEQEKARQAELRRQEEERQKAIRIEQLRLAQIEHERRAAERKAKEAEDALTRKEAERTAALLRTAQAQQEQAVEEAQSVTPATVDPEHIPGARRSDKIEIEVEDWDKLWASKEFKQLIEPNLRKALAIEMVKSQIKAGKTPHIPGCVINISKRVDVRAASEIRIR